jgi:hypothetical protein
MLGGLAKPPSPSFERKQRQGVDRAAGPAGVDDCRRPGVGGHRGRGKRRGGRGLPIPALTLG